VTCAETRELFSALVDDALAPAERAALEAHLAGCAECRRELAGFQRAVSLARSLEPARAPAGFVDRVVAATRPAPWPARLARHLFVPWPKLPVEIAAVLLIGGLAVLLYRGSVEERRAVRHEYAPPSGSSAPPTPPPTVSTPGAAPSTPPAPPARKRAGLEDERAKVASAPPAAEGPASKDESELMAKARRDAAPEDKRAAPRESHADSDRAAGASTPSAVAPAAPSPPTVAAPSRPAPSSAVQTLSRTGPKTDVVARLTTADTEAAERDLATLAGQHGGRQVGRRVEAGVVTVDLELPRERYADFARAASRLGAFAGPPDAATSSGTVRLAVRLESTATRP
jgi:hypothetical protein